MRYSHGVLAVVLLLAFAGCSQRQGAADTPSAPIQDFSSLEERTPPEQPETGPGGKDYKHQEVTQIRRDQGPTGFTVFIPSEPTPDSANVVVFLHGLAQVNPKMYGGWIKHLVCKGNIVIAPRYQVIGTPAKTFETNAVAGITAALAELKQQPVKPLLDNFAVIGHSYGGALSANITVRAQEHGLPKVKALMVNQGWDGIDVRLENGYGGMPADTKLLIVVGEKDVIVGSAFARRLMRETHIGGPFKNLVTHHFDGHNAFAPLNAGHDEPLSMETEFDNGELTTLIALSLPLTRTNAIDYYCYWKLSEALLDCAFDNQSCGTAFGNTPEQRFMGLWGDGRPARELEITPR